MSKPVILVVDDDPEVLRAVARDLRRRYGGDYRILRAPSGAEALDALDELRQRGDPVALLLSDQRMPRMDGVAFLQEGAERYPRAKRALLTAYADTEAAIAAINRSGVDYYLLKPWDPPEERLYPVLDDLLRDWRARWRPGYGGVRVVGTRWSPEAHAVKDFLARNGVPYRFFDVDADGEAGREAATLRGDTADADLPLVILPEGERLAAPEPQAVAEKLGLQTRASDAFYDLAIVGAGPAGLAAAVYGASEGLRTVLIEQEAPGGQAGTSSRIENYLGFPAGLSGADLAHRAVAQARRFGVEILTPQEVAGLSIDGPYKRLTLADGNTIATHVLMLATGVAWRKLPAEGAEPLAGRGVYYGAAMTEAMACKDEAVYIVGAGNSAGQAAMYFAEYAARVVMLVRGDDLGKSMSHYLVERIGAHPKIEVRLNTEVEACRGSEHLECLSLRDNATGETEEVSTRYLFVFIGAAPRTGWLDGVVARDERGFILTGPDLPRSALDGWPLEREPFLLEASVPGVFVAGDVRHESVKRVASAVGEGSVAVHFMHRHLATL
ncbi:MAG: FAD-dependent oxidoreductase [Rhodothermales bacterium]|nr:FAD-dependent oxidoreductase [Rhodothermales bacterium]